MHLSVFRAYTIRYNVMYTCNVCMTVCLYVLLILRCRLKAKCFMRF